MPTFSPPWHYFPTDAPIDGDRCYVCQYRWASPPILAYWDELALQWRIDATATSIDWWIAPWWRLAE